MDAMDLPLWMESVPHNGTETSRAAAARIKPRVLTDRQRVLLFVAGRSQGGTREEIAAGLPMNPDSVRPRVRELLNDELIRENGEVRLTASGNAAKVLVKR